MVSTSIRRKAFGTGTFGRVASACAVVRNTVVSGAAAMAAFNAALSTGAAWFTSRKPCFTPRFMLAAISTLARGPIWRWMATLPAQAYSLPRSGEISWMSRAGSTAPGGKAARVLGKVGKSASAGVSDSTTCPLRPLTPPLTMVKIGCCCVKRPKPPRTDHFCSPVGSQLKPRRGSKLLPSVPAGQSGMSLMNSTS